jgi:phenylacetate-coenzyme A ligase PaaK-like adenylate-forming protein
MSILVRRSRRATGFSVAKNWMKSWLETPPEDISRYQLQRLQIVWKDVITNVPFYQQLVSKKRAPRHIESLSQFFHEIPLGTKQQIVQQPDLFIRTDRKPDHFLLTGGSTGEPLRIGLFHGEQKPAKPDVWLGKIAYGLNEDDRIFLIWGHSSSLEGGSIAYIYTWKRRLKDFLIGYKRVSAYDLSAEKTQKILWQMKSFSPAMLIGYSTAIDALVRDNIKSGFDGRKIGLKFVVATSEILPYKDSARLIEDFFGCPLVMEYGGHDFGLVAHTLPDMGYRVFWHNTLAEIQSIGSDMGECLVTPLYLRYFPAIRYVTGDEIQGPILGSAGQVMGFSKVIGRTNDTILLEDGSRLHSTSVEDCVQWEPGVHRFQIVLEDAGVIIHLVGNPNQTDINAIRKRMAKISPLLAQAKFIFVEDAAVTLAGKRRWVIDRRKQLP